MKEVGIKSLKTIRNIFQTPRKALNHIKQKNAYRVISVTSSLPILAAISPASEPFSQNESPTGLT